MSMNPAPNNSPESQNLTQALHYLNTFNWSIILVGPDKRPLYDWKQYQAQRATEEELRELFFRYLNANIAVVTGHISGLTVVDIDTRHGGALDQLPNVDTPLVETGGGGYHLYFSYHEGLKNKAGVQPGIDIRGDGGYVVLPPSLHVSGKAYRWVKEPDSTAILSPIPQYVIDWCGEQKPVHSLVLSDQKNVFSGVGEGVRNDSAASVAGKLLARFNPDEWDVEAWPLFVAWNHSNTPPLNQVELKTIFDSIKSRETEARANKETWQQKIITNLSTDQGELFHDDRGEGYILLKKTPQRIFKLSSSAFRKWLSHYSIVLIKKPLPQDKISMIIQTLEGHASAEGKEYPLAIRVARVDKVIWYQLSPSKAVKITSSGWEVVEDPPILFHSYGNQKDQVVPITGGDIWNLGEIVNIKTRAQKLLFIVYVVSCMVPGFPHPLLVLHGPQGAGKSTPLRFLKRILDPALPDLIGASKREDELIQTLSHHHFLPLDNLSTMPSWLSDTLARAVTGEGFSKRALYTNDEDIIYTFQRCIAISSINQVIAKADLLDRSILIRLERISKKERKRESELWSDFNAKLPTLMGSIFTTLVQALNEYEKVTLSEHPRMADFAHWGCAIARVIGSTDEEFMQAYLGNIDEQNDEAIEASPIAQVIVAYMSTHDRYQGTAGELFQQLGMEAGSIHIDTRSREWPKDPARMIKLINLVITNLNENGIYVTRDEKARPKRITITKGPQPTDGTDGGLYDNQNLPSIVDNQNTTVSIDFGPPEQSASVPSVELQTSMSDVPVVDLLPVSEGYTP